jgi:hypothetical protein
MQEFNMRKGNCRRVDQVEQPTNCVQKSQRIRCCGRVITQQEVGDQLLTNEQCQGRGQGRLLVQGQGRLLVQGQGRLLVQGQGRGQGRGQRQG